MLFQMLFIPTNMNSIVWKSRFPLPFSIVWLLFSFGYSSHISQHAEYVSPSFTNIEPSWTREILSSEQVTQIEIPSEAVKKQPQEVENTLEEPDNNDIAQESVNKALGEQTDDVKSNAPKEVLEKKRDLSETGRKPNDAMSDDQSTVSQGDDSKEVAQLTEETKSENIVSDTESKDVHKKSSAPPSPSSSSPQQKDTDEEVKSAQQHDIINKAQHESEETEPVQPPQIKIPPSPPPPEMSSSPPSESVPDAAPHDSEFIPSFDEWKKMMLAEQEKEGGQKITSGVSGKKLTSHKRRRNYASYECGAKVVAANSEAESKGRILNEMMDEYMLNPCKAKIWFVIELCDSIQATQLELANFELFSSSPKEFTVYWSEHFPSRDWTSLGTFVAQDIRTLQSFDLPQGGFGKFIKLELNGFYGSEHYCPLSIVRVFGTSMVDEYEALETAEASHQDDDEDRLDVTTEDTSVPARNLFGSARDVVINIVKKATEAFTGDRDSQEEASDDSKKIQKSSLLESWVPSIEEGNTVTKHNDTTKGELAKEPSCPGRPASSLVRLLSPYIRRCRFCSSLPTTDRHHTYAEPTQLCRFLQATLGPLVFQTACMEYHQQIHFLSHPPSCSMTLPSCLPTDEVPSLDESLKSDVVLSDSSASMTDSHPPAEMSLGKDSSDTVSFATESVTLTKETVPVISSDSRPAEASTPPVTGSLHLSDLPSQTTHSGMDLRASDLSMLSSSETPPLPDVTPPTQEIHITTTTQVDVKPEYVGLSVGSIPMPHAESSSLHASLERKEEQSSSTSENMIITKVPVSISETETPMPVGTQTVELPSTPKDVHPAKPGPPHDDKSSKVPSESVSSGAPSPTTANEKASMDNIMVPVAGQKESVFMRLSNRIKYLELNMSLSSQYLEELSQRYRRQMEEMQRAFNRTIGKLNDTARKAAERDLRQQEAIGQLQSKLSNLSLAVDVLLSQRDNLHRQMLETHLCLMIAEAIIMVTILSLCVRRMSAQGHHYTYTVSSTGSVTGSSHHTPLKRHNSVGVLSNPVNNDSLKKRRYSDDVLTGSSPHLMIVEPSIPILVDPPPRVKKKQKNKKHKGSAHPSKSSSLSQLNKFCQPESLPGHKVPDRDVRWKPPLDRMLSSPAGVLFSSSRESSMEKSSSVTDRRLTCNIESFGKDSSKATSAPTIKSDSIGKSRENTTAKRSLSLVPLQNISNGHPTKFKTKEKSPVQLFSWKKLLRLEKRLSF